MNKTITIEGMGCKHCSARIKAGLEALPQVTSAEVSHETGLALVTLNAAIEDAALKAAVEQYDGFTVVAMA